jgi:hypothetical protein
MDQLDMVKSIVVMVENFPPCLDLWFLIQLIPSKKKQIIGIQSRPALNEQKKLRWSKIIFRHGLMYGLSHNAGQSRSGWG